MEFRRQRAPATVTEDDFYSVWAALLQQHLEEEVMQSDVGHHIEKEAVEGLPWLDGAQRA